MRLASCIPHSPEMLPAPKNSWFRRRTAEQPRLQDAASPQYINNNRSSPAAPDLCRFRYNSEVTPGETLRRNASEQRDGPCWRLCPLVGPRACSFRGEVCCLGYFISQFCIYKCLIGIKQIGPNKYLSRDPSRGRKRQVRSRPSKWHL